MMADTIMLHEGAELVTGELHTIVGYKNIRMP